MKDLFDKDVCIGDKVVFPIERVKYLTDDIEMNSVNRRV